ncbi:MAG: twin-arginine translocation signal domain-containing protein, partial [Pyrinomonadaceae bacterium]
MNISRRKFLGAASASAGLMMALDKVAMGQSIMPPIRDEGPLGRMNFLTFFERMNTEFLFLNDKRVQVPLRLV